MQVAEVTGMLEGEDAPPAVFLSLVGARCPGKENPDLSAGIAFSNDIVVRSDARMTPYGVEKGIQVLTLSSQAFQFKVERRPASPTKPHNAALPQAIPTRPLVPQLKAVHNFKCDLVHISRVTIMGCIIASMDGRCVALDFAALIVHYPCNRTVARDYAQARSLVARLRDPRNVGWILLANRALRSSRWLCH